MEPGNEEAIKKIDYTVVFSGGGALGSWQVGAYEQILKTMVNPPTTVIGSSAGSLNAAAIYAGLELAEMKKLWDLPWFRVFWISWPVVVLLLFPLISIPASFAAIQLFDVNLIYQVLLSICCTLIIIVLMIWFGGRYLTSLFTTGPLRRKVKGVVGRLNDINSGKVGDMVITATDLLGGIKHAFYLSKNEAQFSKYNPVTQYQKIKDADDFIEQLMGTSAIPLAFPHNKQLLFDGGVLNNHPLSIADQMDKTIIFLLIPAREIESPDERLKSLRLMSTLGHLMNTWINVNLKQVVEEIKNRNKNSLNTQYQSYEKRKVCIIRPTDCFEYLDVQMLSFGKNIKKLIKDGERAAKQSLAQFNIDDEDAWFPK